MDDTSSRKEHVSLLGKKIACKLGYCAALGKPYLSLLVLHYIIRWFCPYLTTARSFGIVVVRVINPT